MAANSPSVTTASHDFRTIVFSAVNTCFHDDTLSRSSSNMAAEETESTVSGGGARSHDSAETQRAPERGDANREHTFSVTRVCGSFETRRPSVIVSSALLSRSGDASKLLTTPMI
ncbi:hypothetical protein KUCAC02_032469 [Chaenocephalus aceratus]|nr:hypothetical protein KUCAC02_032469 [Chaenocephalus aceratus]